MNNYINKQEFEKKLNSLKTKYAIEDNFTLSWVIYILIFVMGSVLFIGAGFTLLVALALFFIGLPLAFIEGVIKGIRKK